MNVNEVSQAPDITANVETEKPEEMSVAQLLVSEASESVKKAALRKMFLSEEFNVRDGLDDYDDDYSNLKSLSKDVAETLRDWVKEKWKKNQTLKRRKDLNLTLTISHLRWLKTQN